MPETDPGAPHVDVGGYLLGTLDAADRAAFAAHVEGCERCQRELEELRGLPGLVAEAAEPVEVPADLRPRVMAAIAREPGRQAEPARPAPRPSPGARRQPGGRRRLGWAAVAAAAAVVLAFAAGVGLGRQLTPPRPAPAPQPAAMTVHLTSPTGGPATGDATIRDTAGGRSIQLTVRGLPPPPAGHFYTCWLVAGDDTLQRQDRVSVGSFVTPGSGEVTVRWETAADLGRYPHLGVTLEPDNGNPLHQGPKVLAGP